MATQSRKDRNSRRPGHSDDWKKAVIERALLDMGRLKPTEREQIEKSLEVQLTYQGEYIAYVDSWTKRGGVERFSRRVLAHSPAEEDVCRFVESLPPAQRAKVVMDYEPDFYITSNGDAF